MTLKSGPNLGVLVNGAASESHYTELMRQWRALDALVQPGVLARVAAVPTTGLNDGDRYLLTANPNINKIARYSVDLVTPGWEYYTPKDGWVTWSTADQKAYRFKGTPTPAWAEESSGGGGSGTQSISIACSDLVSAVAAGTTKAYIDIPYNFTISEVQASLLTAQAAGSIFTVDVNVAGATILSTKLTIDNTEVNSITAAVPAVISSGVVTKGQRITIDVDQIGDGSARGLIVTLVGV